VVPFTLAIWAPTIEPAVITEPLIVVIFEAAMFPAITEPLIVVIFEAAMFPTIAVAEI